MRKIAFALGGLLFMGVSACNSDASSKINNGDESAEVSTMEEENASGVDASTVEAEGSPKFSFEEEQHNFGKIDEGTVAKHDFTFTNTGDSPLIITNAKGSCGCTVPEWPREPIQPGETGTIHVEFNSRGRTGNQTKQVTLNANTVPNTKVLRIQAQVIPTAKEEGGEAAS